MPCPIFHQGQHDSCPLRLVWPGGYHCGHADRGLHLARACPSLRWGQYPEALFHSAWPSTARLLPVGGKKPSKTRSIYLEKPGINPFIKRQTLRVLVRWVPRCTKPGENNQLGSHVVLMMFDVGKEGPNKNLLHNCNVWLATASGFEWDFALSSWLKQSGLKWNQNQKWNLLHFPTSRFSTFCAASFFFLRTPFEMFSRS